MATNPMQRKANMYLLLGVFFTLLITGAIIVFLFMQLKDMKEEMEAREAAKKTVYIVSDVIKSGEKVTYDKLTQKSIDETGVPTNALSVELTENTIAKIDLNVGTVITDNMVCESEEKTTKDLRKQEYNMIVLPTQIQSGDYIDIRLRLSNGVDYIVATKKMIEIPTINGVDSPNTINMNMNETEIMVMSNAIIEAYIDQGSLLYATTYVEPGLQERIIPTYVASGAVQNAINSNPNIEKEAKNALFTRYNQNSGTRTNIIDPILNQYAEERAGYVQEGIGEETSKAKEERQAYLESLSEY